MPPRIPSRADGPLLRHLARGALERLAAAHDVEVWPERTPPSPEDLRVHAAQAEGLLCLLTDRIDEDIDAAPSTA